MLGYRGGDAEASDVGIISIISHIWVYEGRATKQTEMKNILKHKHWIPNLEALVVDVEVRASTVRTLLDEHDLRDDLVVLSVDAEGHDQIIVRSVDLSKITPYFIVFEHMPSMHSAAGAVRANAASSGGGA